MRLTPFRHPKRRKRQASTACRGLRLERLQERQLLAADVPFGATPLDTGEFMLGSVTVTPVFFESNGEIDPSTENWTEPEIQATLEKIQDSLDWWSDLLANQTDQHALEFVIDTTFAESPVETPYEPINRTSDNFQNYVGRWMTDLGYAETGTLDRAIRSFNDDQRQLHETDWAFTMVVVDSSNDADGLFPSGGLRGAFAFAGGMFSVVPSERPTSTFTHETGHIFWARDEYQGAGNYTDQRGYYNAQNINAWDNPTPNFIPAVSIMGGQSEAIEAFALGETNDDTLALIGWQDSDGDGIFDVLDVPLNLDIAGSYSPEQDSFRLEGSATVQTLPNQNSAGTQSDLTTNRVTGLEYRIDGGQWVSLLTGDDYQVQFDIEIPASDPSQMIEVRALSNLNGVTSPIVGGLMIDGLYSGTGGGVIFLDANENGVRDANEKLLPAASMRILNQDQTELTANTVVAAELPISRVALRSDLRFSAVGELILSSVTVGSIPVPASQQRFENYNFLTSQYSNTWASDEQLQVSANQPTGKVTVEVTGVDTAWLGEDSGSYARVAAFNDQDELIARETVWVPAGERQSVVVEDQDGQITKVLISGHAETEIMIDSVQFGGLSQEVSQAQATFSTDRLGEGEYVLDVVPTNFIYQINPDAARFSISQGGDGASLVGGPVLIPAQIGDSPRHNPLTPTDVNQNGSITVGDAIVVINDLAKNGSRTLTADQLEGPAIDVNNDGKITPFDAISVINQLVRQMSEPENVPAAAMTLNADNVAESEQVVLGTSAITTAATSTKATAATAAPLQTPLTINGAAEGEDLRRRLNTGEPDELTNRTPSDGSISFPKFSPKSESSDQSRHDRYPDNPNKDQSSAELWPGSPVKGHRALENTPWNHPKLVDQLFNEEA